MRVGIIGMGKMGNNHLRVYSEMSDVEVVGIADINDTLVKKMSKKYKIPGFSDYRELLKENLDAVSIVVPTNLHKDVAIDCIKAGCHILVEKPIADSIDSAFEIIKTCKEFSKKMLVGHIERFNPAVEIVKKIIDKGELGDIVSISTKRVGIHDPKRNKEGVILDLAPHDVDIISYLYGDRVKEVYSVASGKHKYNNSETHATIVSKFYNGGIGISEISWLLPKKERNLSVVGIKGVAMLDFIEQTVKVYDKKWTREAIVVKQEPLKKELSYFIRYVSIKEKRAWVSSEDSIHALAVALSAISSYKSDTVVEVPAIGFSVQKNIKLRLISSY